MGSLAKRALTIGSELNYYISNKTVHGWIREWSQSWKRDSIPRRGSYSSCICFCSQEFSDGSLTHMAWAMCYNYWSHAAGGHAPPGRHWPLRWEAHSMRSPRIYLESSLHLPQLENTLMCCNKDSQQLQNKNKEILKKKKSYDVNTPRGHPLWKRARQPEKEKEKVVCSAFPLKSQIW